MRWWRDPQVTAAFQYTFREDATFPTGLVNAELTNAIRRWPSGPRGAARASRGAPPPAAAC